MAETPNFAAQRQSVSRKTVAEVPLTGLFFWRNEANYLLFLARRASDTDDEELLEELEEQAREMADMVEARWRAEGL